MLTTKATLGVIKTNSMDASLATAQVTAAATSHPIKKKTHKCAAGVWSKVASGRQSAAFANLDEMRALSCDASLDWEIKLVDRSVWATGVNWEKPKLFADYQPALHSVNTMSADAAAAIMASISLIALN